VAISPYSCLSSPPCISFLGGRGVGDEEEHGLDKMSSPCPKSKGRRCPRGYPQGPLALFFHRGIMNLPTGLGGTVGETSFLGRGTPYGVIHTGTLTGAFVFI